MKKIIVTVFAVLFCFINVSIAEEISRPAATKEECLQKVKEAVEMAKKKGLEKTIAAINEPEGQFVWKDTYVFCCNTETATVLAHPVKPGLIGKTLAGIRDINGKMFFVEFTNLAKAGTPGWVDYMWPKAEEKAPSRKSTYIYPLPELNVYFASGIYQ